MAALLLAPGSNCVIEPLAVTALPPLPLKLAFRRSEKPSTAALLLTVKACCAVAFRRRLPKLIGSGVAAPVARRKKLALTLTTCEASARSARPLVPAPVDVSATVAVPVLAPAAPAAKLTPKVLLLLPPWARLANEPTVNTPPVLPLNAAARPSWKLAGAALVLVSEMKPLAPTLARTLPRLRLVEPNVG